MTRGQLDCILFDLKNVRTFFVYMKRVQLSTDFGNHLRSLTNVKTEKTTSSEEISDLTVHYHAIMTLESVCISRTLEELPLSQR